MKTIPSLLIAAVFASLTFAVWAYLNRPTREPPWPPLIQGFAFSPFRANEDPTHFEMPTDAEIDADLALLEGRVKAIRTYSVGATLADVPELAERHGLNVALGVWLDTHRDKNEQQLQAAIELANTQQNVVRVIVGNEVLLRGDLAVEELAKYLDRAREAISQPVGTAETWDTWLAHPSSPTTSISSACTCCPTGKASRSTRRSTIRWRSSSACRRPSRTSRSW